MEEITREDVYRALGEVIDPEIGINLVDLGLIYHVDVEKDRTVNVEFTLTSPGCPLEYEIKRNIVDEVMEQTGAAKVNTKLVWTPMWSTEFMSEEARFSLGYPV